MLILPAIDILGGKCVRLRKGDYKAVTKYFDDPFEVALSFVKAGARALHIVDLDGARNGKPINKGLILKIANSFDVDLQVGGGIRTFDDAKFYLENGVSKIILGSSALSSPSLIKKIVQKYGSDRSVVSIDINGNEIAFDGWLKQIRLDITKFLDELFSLGVRNLIITDVSKDGTLAGVNCGLFKSIAKDKRFKVIAAGGVSCQKDLKRLSVLGLSGVISGKAIYDGRIKLKEAIQSFDDNNQLAKRIVPCMDISDGRVKKGVKFANLIDAGDPVELGKYYSNCGADELVFLDITATVENRKTRLELVKKIARNISIPFTVGGGVKSLEDIKSLLDAGADKVAIGSFAIENPEFVRAAAMQFGSQCIVISLDCKRVGNKYLLFKYGGRLNTETEAIAFAKLIANLGAGELLVNSLDRDGMKDGFDINLLRQISDKVNIPVIASSGAGKMEDFLKAINEGLTDAVLAASVFHYGEIKIPDLKKYLSNNNISIRL